MTTKQIISEAFMNSHPDCYPIFPIIFPAQNIKVELSSYNKETGEINWDVYIEPIRSVDRIEIDLKILK